MYSIRKVLHNIQYRPDLIKDATAVYPSVEPKRITVHSSVVPYIIHDLTYPVTL